MFAKSDVEFYKCPKFQLVTVKYHEVEALFCKMFCCFEKIVSVHTKYQYQVTVLGTDPVLEIGPILRHLNSRSFLIPNPSRWLTPHFKGIFMDFPTK